MLRSNISQVTFADLPPGLIAQIRETSGPNPSNSVELMAILKIWVSELILRFDGKHLRKRLFPHLGTILMAGFPNTVIRPTEYAATRAPFVMARHAAYYLFEVALIHERVDPPSKARPSDSDLEILFSVASFYCEVSNLYAYEKGRVADLRYELVDETTVVATVEFTIDTASWHRRYAEHLDNERRPNDKPLFDWLTGQCPDPPDRWAEIDEAFRQEKGFGLRATLAILTTAAGMKQLDGAIPRTAVVRAIARKGGFEEREVERSVAYLTFGRAPNTPDPEPWKQREREQRIARAPFLELPNNHLWVDYRILIPSLQVYISYFSDLLTPWPERSGKHHQVDMLIKNLAGERNTRFEHDVAGGLRELGYQVREGVKSRALGIDFSGDIDVLAAKNLDGINTIVVIEAKDPISVNSPGQIASQIANFRGWRSKHRARVEAVSTPAGVAAVSKLFSLGAATKHRVFSRIVTRSPAIAGYSVEFHGDVDYLPDFYKELRDQ